MPVKTEQEIGMPFAVFFKFKCASYDGTHIKEAGQLVYLKDGESFEDCHYRVATKLNNFSFDSRYNVWIEDSHNILSPSKSIPDVPARYGLS